MADDQPFNHFSRIGDQMHQAFSQIVRTAAFNIQANYQRTARRDTGFQVNSAYVVTNDSSSYHGGNDPDGRPMLPEIKAPTSDTEATVAVGADYAVFNEVGTVHKPGDGAMAQAVENEREPFQQALTQLRLKG